MSDLCDEQGSQFTRFCVSEAKPALPVRILPSGPPGPGRFGAYYTTLKYYDAWDAPWRIGEHADVIVWIKTESTKPMKITLTPSKG